MHKRISISRINFGRTIFMFVLLFAHIELSAWPQNTRSAPVNIDPERMAIVSAWERLVEEGTSLLNVLIDNWKE